MKAKDFLQLLSQLDNEALEADFVVYEIEWSCWQSLSSMDYGLQPEGKPVTILSKGHGD